MRHTLALLAAIGFFCVGSILWVSAQQARPAANTKPMSMDEVLVTLRTDVQADRAGRLSMAYQLQLLQSIPLAH